jgi:hypothetical protein
MLVSLKRTVARTGSRGMARRRNPGFIGNSPPANEKSVV